MTRADEAPSAGSERVLVLVRGPRDAKVTRELLELAGFDALACADIAELVERMGQGAAAALVEEETLFHEDSMNQLATTLHNQPPWSDFPIVVFSAGGERTKRGPDELARLLGNVIYLDRPVRTRSVVASVRAAIRSRRRQYEARRAIDARDAFLAMLGHELRNPLGAISLATALLAGKSSTESPPRRELVVIDRQARHLARLVDDLLDVARVTQGKVVLKRETLDLVEVVRSAFEAHDARAHDHGLSYELRVPDVAVWVDGDRQRLEQVFANLITNAIKYTRRGDAVTVAVGSEHGASEEAVVSVTDTGVGIVPETIGRLFEAFAQADRTLDRTEGGIGLGLALVRSLVQLHGGTAEGRSEGLNRGSSFVVRLPAASSAVPVSPGSGAALVAQVPARRVVVVEDNEDIRELLTDLLAHEGHQVSCAEDGPRGLDALVELVPDIAFIDLGLPGFDGLELARRARASGVRTTLVAITGYGQTEDRARAFDAGFDDHLTKPVLDCDLQRVMLRVA
jgi:signal transduction histidine kinase